MDNLIPVINKLQDVFTTVGAEAIQLPQIAVVGSQSSGKSSVLENIVGKDFLPRGHGIVTRRPLILQLVHRKPGSPRPALPDDPSSSGGHTDDGIDGEDVEEWGEFLHAPGKRFISFAEIRKEIEAETDRVTGSNKGISSKPINLRIYSPNVLNLTLVDLPGITKVPVGDQPEDIEKQIRTLVRSYISNPNCIILAVTPANVDLANSDALKLAKTIDPEGNRTIGVCTKIDLMDAGTDAMDILSGRVVPVKLGFIGVVNRSQADINTAKPIADSLKSEEQFFKSHPAYQAIAHRCGTAYLSKALNKLLMHHIRDCLPDLKTRINAHMAEAQQAYNAYGEPLMDKFNKGSLMLQIITKFCSNYCGAIEGTSRDIQTNELTGGARICYIFHETFGRTLENVDPLEGLTIGDIRTAIRNATGPRPALFVPEVSFELLVKRQIRRMEEPALRCVELVFEELLRITQQCETPELLRFQNLRDHISETVTTLLRNRLPAANVMIENLVAIELAYINTNHPDFTTGSQAVSSIMDNQPSNKNRHSYHPSMSSGNSSLEVPNGRARGNSFGSSNGVDGMLAESGDIITTNGSRPGASRSTSMTMGANGVPLPLQAASVSNAGQSAPAPLSASLPPQNSASSGGLFGGLFGFRPNKPKEDGNTELAEAAHDVAARSGSVRAGNGFASSSGAAGGENPYATGRLTTSSSSPAHFDDLMLDHLPTHLREDRRALTSREQMETELIQTLIINYFKIVRKNIQDTVPKAIMHFLVNWIKEHIQSELVSQLYREDLFETMLEESVHIAVKRKQAAEMLSALKRAAKVLVEIRADANVV